MIPAMATAELDCRLLPDQDVGEFIDTLRVLINDSSISIEVLMQGKAAEPTEETQLYRAIENVVQRHFRAAPVIPGVGTGFTDSRFFRPLGIACYGFTPVLIPPEELSGVHGNDERISIKNVRRGVPMMLEILEAFVY